MSVVAVQRVMNCRPRVLWQSFKTALALVPTEKRTSLGCNLELPIDEVDETLFAVATRVTVRNRRIARFWTVNWTQGAMLCLHVSEAV
jgi:hypothetical protein